MTDYEIPGLPLSLRVRPDNHAAHAGRRLLISLAPPPVGEPCLLKAAKGLVAALEFTLYMLGDVKQDAKDVQDAATALITQLSNRPKMEATVEIDAALSGTKNRHPEWWVLTRPGLQRKAGCAAKLFIGCAALVSLHQGKRLTRGMCSTAEALMTLKLAPTQLKVLLNGKDPADAAGEAWPRQLRRLWVQATKLFSTDPTPPSPSHADRVASQILDGALAPTARKRGGAFTHRHLSKGQMLQFQTWSEIQLQKDTLEGTLAVLISLTGFSVEVAADLELIGVDESSSGSSSAAWINLDLGATVVDYGLVVHAASTTLQGALPSSKVIKKPLPLLLRQHLLERLRTQPEAKRVKDLFPGQAVPESKDALWTSHAAMPPTWARLRRTFGTWLRARGINNLIAAVLTGDFHHIPRSKLYYARVGPLELEQAFSSWFAWLGWGMACPIPTPMGFGCQAVHPNEMICRHDHHLQKEMEQVSAGKNSRVDRLVAHHNAFMQICGFRLSLLLALRESTAIELFADVNEDRHKWWALEDKLTPNSVGAAPQPISGFTRLTVQAIRAHCSALANRLSKAGHPHSAACKWAQQVARRQPVRLLCHVQDPDALRPLATRDFLTSAAPHLYQLAPDFGRKALENLTRQAGLMGSETDGLLRHNVSGQHRLTSTSHSAPADFHATTARAIDAIATQLFVRVAYGLSKGELA